MKWRAIDVFVTGAAVAACCGLVTMFIALGVQESRRVGHAGACAEFCETSDLGPRPSVVVEGDCHCKMPLDEAVVLVNVEHRLEASR